MVRVHYKAGSVTRFGRHIRAERISKRITQSGLAAKVGVSPTYLCRVELGDVDAPPTPEFIVRLADALGVDRVALLLESGRDDCAAKAREIKSERKKK